MSEGREMSEEQLRGKTALVTGAGSDIGLGWAMASALLTAGALVALMDVDFAALARRGRDAQALAGDDSYLTITGDVTSPADATAAVERAVEQFGRLDILINNAGINPVNAAGSSFWDLDPVIWSRVVATNLSGAFLMARAAVGQMRERGWGRIIGVTTSLDTMLRSAPYGPAKAGHEALVAVMARELEASGVTANVLVPGGATVTNMIPPGRDTTGFLRPEVMQNPVVWLASEGSDGFNGRRIIAQFWDEALPIEERLAKASAPAGWPQLGRSV